MTIFTITELRDKISNSIPKDADEDIVVKVLEEELRKRNKPKNKTDLCSNFAGIIPDGCPIEMVLEGSMALTIKALLFYAKEGHLKSALKSTIAKFHSSYVIEFYNSFRNDEEWRAKHKPEILSWFYEQDETFFSKEIKPIMKVMFEL